MNSSLDDADSVCNTGTPASPATPSADPRVTGVARTLGLPAPELRVDASPAVPARSMPASVPRAPAPLAVPPPADAPVPTDPPEPGLAPTAAPELPIPPSILPPILPPRLVLPRLAITSPAAQTPKPLEPIARELMIPSTEITI